MQTPILFGRDSMTFDEYIRNPMGKANAVFSQRFVYEEFYTKKFDLLVAREAGQWPTILKKKSDSTFYMYIKVPSEAITNFYYDVVIEFTANSAEVRKENSLKNYDCKFFSNDASFMYTFAQAFDKRGILIPSLKSKIPDIVFKQASQSKNPDAQVGYVKSIYFAYLYYRLKGFHLKSFYVDNRDIAGLVATTSQKMDEYQIKKAEQSKSHKRTKEVSSNDIKRYVTKSSPYSKKVKTVSSVKTISSNRKK